MKLEKDKIFVEERALFRSNDIEVDNCTFEGENESPIKECNNMHITNTNFEMKYPLWYSNNIRIDNSLLGFGARAGVWYTNNLEVENVIVFAKKTFRRCHNVLTDNMKFTDASETFWFCEDLKLNNLNVEKGDYFCSGSKNIYVNNLHLVGNYTFDTCENIEMHNSTIIGRDTFWNCKNVVVYDSYISGKYIGWNTENLTFINCKLESHQGFCYIKNLKIINCEVVNTDLAFEYCENLDVEATTVIDSIKNPYSGKIICKGCKELILNEDEVDLNKTQIIYK